MPVILVRLVRSPDVRDNPTLFPLMYLPPVTSMTYFDVFNGDADGLCALQQLRLDDPVESVLISGTKREIALLDRVPQGGAISVTVLDVSLEKNRASLVRLLDAGARVRYFDHHFAGDIPDHPLLDAHLEALPDKGTSLLVNDYLSGRHLAWAVVGTFGDNFEHSARRAAVPLGLAEDELGRLRELGVLLNYNGYGERVEDLHVAPDALFRTLRPYANPLDFVRDDPTFAVLRRGYEDDMAHARGILPEFADQWHRLLILPARPWARRASGVLANELALAAPGQAHAILTRFAAGGFLVSVRAPLARPVGADDLCRRFSTGGGRKAAAGVNVLAEADYDAFVRAFRAAFLPA
jgi:hypothetical protein